MSNLHAYHRRLYSKGSYGEKISRREEITKDQENIKMKTSPEGEKQMMGLKRKVIAWGDSEAPIMNILFAET